MRAAEPFGMRAQVWRQQRLERYPALELRERRAEAAVRPEAEGELTAGQARATGVEPIGVRKAVRIATIGDPFVVVGWG